MCFFGRTINYLLTLIASTILLQNCVDCNLSIPANKFWQFKRTFYDTSGGSTSDNHNYHTSSGISATSPAFHPRTLSASDFIERQNNLQAISLANEHLMKIRSFHRCNVPRPKLVRVKDIHNVPSKEYLPRCTVLHQCDDESGCCEDSTMSCGPTEIQEVQLYFYAIEIERDSREQNDGDHNSEGVRGKPFPEMLSFTNHTKCGCEEINYRPRTNQASLQATRLNSLVERKENAELTDQEEDELNEKLSNSGYSHTKQCSFVDCPSPFFVRLQPHDETCVCDCFDRDRDCLRIKKGIDPLSPAEKRCVKSRTCLEPLCDTGGTFNRQDGICVIPKHFKLRHSKSHYMRHQNNHQQKHHRLSERD